MENENFLDPINQEDVARREHIREHTTRGLEAMKIPRKNIKVRSGFNERDDWGDIPALGIQMFTIGQLEPITVDLLKDGTALLVDGHRRKRAADWAVENGYEMPAYLYAYILPKNTSDQNRLLIMIGKNNGGKRHTELEESRIYRRLQNTGMSQSQIAKHAGVSEMIVSNRLLLDKLSDYEKKAIQAGEVSYTAALELAKRESDPEMRQRTIQAALDGGGKLKVKEALLSRWEDIKDEAAEELSSVVQAGVNSGTDDIEPKKIIGNLDRVPSEKKEPKEPPATDPYAPDISSKALLLISESLLLLKAMDRLIVPGTELNDLSFKLENNLVTLKKFVS